MNRLQRSGDIAIVFAVILELALCGCRQGNGVRWEFPKNPAQVFALLDRFDTLKTEELRFVRVATGNWIRYDGEPPVNCYRFGLLKSEDEEGFTVRYLDLTRQTLKASPAGTPEHERVGYELYDIARYAHEVAGELRHADDLDHRYYMSPSAPMSPRAQALLLARACARRGLEREVTDLFSALDPLERALWDLADGLANLLAMDFADPTLTWADLLEHHKRYLVAFPEHWRTKFITERTKLLRRILAEERAHCERRPRGRKATDTEEEITELIFSLRNEFHPVTGWYVDGYFVPTTAPRPKPGTRPSDRLQELGRAAVPSLIEAITDKTLTRTVWYSSRYGGYFRVLRVGVFTEEVLEKETGLKFYGEDAERQAKWRSWWKTCVQKGEEAALVEIAARGECESITAAKKLLARRPDRVRDVIAGIRAATNRYYRKDLVEVLAQVKAEPVTEFLFEELKTGPYVLYDRA